MEILKSGSMEKAAEFDEKNDIKVRFECERCGCEFVASSFAGECVRTSLSMPDVTEKWTAKCPEFGCNHPCYSDDEIIGDDMYGVKVCGLCKHFERFETDSTRGSCRNNHKFGVLCVGEHACEEFKKEEIMTFDKLNELNAIKDTIQKMTEDIDNLDEFADYHMIQIIGRVRGETLDQADVLLDIDGDYYPGLIEIIRKYIVNKREEVIKDFEEA